jgi:hypothetical protein
MVTSWQHRLASWLPSGKHLAKAAFLNRFISPSVTRILGVVRARSVHKAGYEHNYRVAINCETRAFCALQQSLT